MTGDIARAITLTTYGTAFLKEGHSVTSLTLEHPSFIYAKSVEFLFFKKNFFGKPTLRVYADTPINWLKKLKEEGCRDIRLVFETDNSIALNGEVVPDHMLAGFVGGGGLRFIETVFENHSDLWQSREEVTNRDAPDHRIWSVRYFRFAKNSGTIGGIYSIEGTKDKLGERLKAISAFAKKQSLSLWAESFDHAYMLLNSPSPLANDRNKDIVPIDIMPSNALQLLAASRAAWCFGGMGSWNDIGFSDKNTEAIYDRLTSELYEAVNESYLAVANSGLSANLR